MSPLKLSCSRQCIAFSLLLLCYAGCQTSSFRAASLPQEFRVTRQKENEKVDLAHVTSRGIGKAIISPSDLLEVTLTTGRDDETVAPTLTRVADDGTIDVPIVGPVPVAGLEAYDASQNITSLAIERGMYRRPIVTVEIKSKAVNRITIMGAVDEPGIHEIPRGSCDLVSALAASGGLTDEASSVVEIIRQPNFQYLSKQSATSEAKQSESPSTIELASYQQLGHPGAQPAAAGWKAGQTIQLDLTNKRPTGPIDFKLRDRDIIRVLPRKEEMIYVAGLVEEPGQFNLPPTQDVHLLDAIALAGGKSSPVADKIFVIRRLENQPEPIVIQASLSNAKKNGLENLRLQAGDTVSVERTPSTVVVDTIGKFFRLSIGVATSTIF